MSTIPEVLPRLVKLFTDAALTIENNQLEVSDGVPLQTESDFLIVGEDDPNSDRPAVEGVPQVVNEGNVYQGETYAVHCLLSIWIGDADIPAARSRMFAYRAAFHQAIAVDRSLGIEGVMDTMPTDFQINYPIGGSGATANCRFSIQVRACR